MISSGSSVEIKGEDKLKLATFLLQLFHVDLVHFHRFEPRMADAVSDRPVTSAFARWQIDHNCPQVQR